MDLSDDSLQQYYPDGMINMQYTLEDYFNIEAQIETTTMTITRHTLEAAKATASLQ